MRQAVRAAQRWTSARGAWLALMIALSFGCRAASAATPVGAARERSGASPDCYQRARKEALLDEQGARTLCLAADSAWPVDCFRRAQASIPLAQEALIALCRCARSIEPAECFERGLASTALDEDELLAFCSPTVRLGFITGCLDVL